MMKTWAIGLLSVPLVWASGWGLAEAAPGSANGVTTTLSTLAGGKKTVMLRPGQATANLPWKVAAHDQATNATLTVHYLVSPATPRGSQLMVAVNGKVLAAIVVHPHLPRGRFTVRLGRRAWPAGVYDVAIHEILGAQAGASKAKPGSTWTQIDYSASQLHYQTRFLPWRHLHFGQLRMMLAESARNGIVTLPLRLYGPVTPTLMTASQEAVAGMALRSSRPLAVRAGVGQTVLPAASGSRPNIGVMLGPVSRLPAAIRPATPITGPTILLVRNPIHPAGAVLVFTGQTPTQVLWAARAFALTRTALPLGHEWVLTGRQSLAGMHFGPGNAAYPDEKVDLRKLIGRHAHLGVPHSVIHIPFWMPGGLFAPRQSNMKMWLTMAAQPLTVPGHRPVITVTANHHWVSEWTLTPGVARYQTTIPFSALVPGENRVTFHIANGKAAVFPRSALRLPKTHRYAVLPNLTLWQRTGFPLVADGVGEHLSVWYSAPRPADWSAGLTLFARLAQASHSPLPAANARFTMPDYGNVLAVGALSSLNPHWLAASPLHVRKRGAAWHVAAGHAWAGASRLEAGAYLLESRAPYKGGITVTLLASHNALLPAASAALVSPRNWRRLHGDLAWEQTDGRYRVTRIGPRFVYGKRRTGWFWVFVFSVRPWLWIVASSVLVLIATLLVWIYALRKRAQWRAEEVR